MKPCNECPFRRDSMAGWLGGFSVAETIECAVSESNFDCHLTRTHDNKSECVGRHLFASKMAKMFRREDLETLRKKLKENNNLDDILNYKEFKEHHA